MKALKEKQASTDAPTSHLHTATSRAPSIKMVNILIACKRVVCVCVCVKMDVYKQHPDQLLPGNTLLQ